jgi:hypothetical protein
MIMSDGPARYFFNILTPSGVVEDIEGSELPSLEEARAEAIKDIRFLMSAAIRQGRDISSRSIEICNEAGDVVTVVGFQEAISESDLPM